MSTIVLITGSPRKRGNSNRMADAFAKAAEAHGHRIVRFDAAKLRLTGCLACNHCYSQGKACVQDDGFNEVAAALEAADGLVVAAPVYWYTFPGELKNLLDRTYSLAMGGRSFTGKRVALISCCADAGMDTFEGIEFAWKKSMGLVNATILPSILVPNVNEAGAIEGTDGCERARALAEQF